MLDGKEGLRYCESCFVMVGEVGILVIDVG